MHLHDRETKSLLKPLENPDHLYLEYENLDSKSSSKLSLAEGRRKIIIYIKDDNGIMIIMAIIMLINKKT